MKLTTLVSDEDAVSPVIGVILMVAITVILAAVIGTFVLGLGGQVGNNAPSANIGYEYTTTNGNTTLIANHNGGDPVEAKNLEMKVDGTNLWNSSGIHQGLDNNHKATPKNTEVSTAWSNKLTAGDQLKLIDDERNNHIADGDSVQLIWSSPDGGDSAIIADGTVSV